jgi:hypothetical protein
MVLFLTIMLLKSATIEIFTEFHITFASTMHCKLNGTVPYIEGFSHRALYVQSEVHSKFAANMLCTLHDNQLTDNQTTYMEQFQPRRALNSRLVFRLDPFNAFRRAEPPTRPKSEISVEPEPLCLVPLPIIN